MNIAFVISQLGGGGAERVISILANNFVKSNHKISLITLYKREIVYKLDSRIDLIELECSTNRIFGTIEQIIKLRHIFSSINPNVIISFLPIVNMTVLLANIGAKYKVIVSERNDPGRNPRRKILRMLRNFIYKKADGFVFQTPDAQAYFNKIAKRNSVVIPNPISDNLPKHYNGKRRKCFVTAVRLDKQKNLKMLINAFYLINKDYPEFTLEIYGEGPEKNNLLQQVSDLNLQNSVVFKGFSKDLHKNIVDAYSFVLSSDYEGLSNSLLEALAMGIPVISTDHPIGGARMFIDDGVNGLLTRVADSVEMKNKMLFAINNPERMAEMGELSVKIRESLSENNIVRKWYKLIKDLN